ETAGRRLRAGPEPAGRFPWQLSARRHGAWRAARPDGRRDHLVAQPCRARPADTGRDRRRGAQEPDADQGARPVGQAQAAGETAARSGRRKARRMKSLIALTALLLTALPAAAQDDVANFYKGKT